ncbi:hypothetical protein V8C86DRAFT_2724148 [Haematococcus lacustris]
MDRAVFLLTALCVIAECNARSCTSVSEPAVSESVNQHTLCVLGPGEIWTPSALNLTGSLTVAGTPGSQASTLDLSFLGRTSFAPGTSLTFQDLTVVTDIALPRANTPLSFLVPSTLTGSVNISFERVTLRLPSSCTSLGQYATLLCRGSVNSSLAISRWGVRFTSWATAAIRARHLNLTCGAPLPPSYNLLCTSMPVREATELLAALAATEGMAAGTTSFIHVLSNISLQVRGRTQPLSCLQSHSALPATATVVTDPSHVGFHRVSPQQVSDTKATAVSLGFLPECLHERNCMLSRNAYKMLQDVHSAHHAMWLKISLV